ncbi:MAG TPA: hypothetical protein VE309_12075 [Caulobacteraceae bacterium]|jgi:hypothetical protein|nr:hypothetical protein [Caulobacteraceae bacterium]
MSWLALIAAEVIGVTQPAPAAAPPSTPPAAIQPAPTPAATPAPAPTTTPTPGEDEEGGVVPLSSQPEVGESQIRANFQTAEARRGALDGRWGLARADGGPPIYVFQFSDSGGAPDARATTPMSPQVEGSWRDMRRPDALNGSGITETIRRNGQGLTIVFYEDNQQQTFDLQPAGAAWTGDVTLAGVRTKVLMTRE